MGFKNKIIAKIKFWLVTHNEINKSIVIPATTKVAGSKLSANVALGSKVKVTDGILSGPVSIGNNSKVSNVVMRGEITINENCKIHGASLVGKITIGRFSSLWGPNLDLISLMDAPISIGAFCSIARNVTLQTFNHNHKKATTYYMGKNFFNEKWPNERVSKGGITIGNDVWIGAHSVILGGTTIGDGAVVAANSVVTKDIAPYAIVAGTPAKIIGFRFEEAIIEQLLQLQWWHWTAEEINSNKAFFENELTKEILQGYLKSGHI